MAGVSADNAQELPVFSLHVNMRPFNILEIAKDLNCRLFVPSSVSTFGDNAAKDNTRQNEVQRPKTIFGITKVGAELLCDYYFHKYGVDTRGLRLPGLISHKKNPAMDVSDYANEMYFEALKKTLYFLTPKERIWI